MKENKLLIIGGALSLVASLLHIGIVIGGSDWYRFFGAGERMAELAEFGSAYPAIITITIAIVLALWGLYAFSGARIIRPLPLLKQVLAIISFVYISRGVFGIPMVIYLDHPYLNELEERMTFMIFSSVISLSLGLFYWFGLARIRSIR